MALYFSERHAAIQSISFMLCIAVLSCFLMKLNNYVELVVESRESNNFLQRNFLADVNTK